MRLVQTLWTQTSRFKFRPDYLLVQTLALALAERHHGTVILSTDSHGELLAKEMGWTVQVERWLDNVERTGLRHIWALGKLHTLERVREPAIQFDADVLLMEPLPQWFLEAGIVAQSVDYTGGYIHDPMKEARRICGYPEDWTPYNCGVAGGCDVDSVRRYATEALDNAPLFRGTCPKALPGTSVSMILEQWSLSPYNPTVLDPGHPYYCDIMHRPYAHLAGDRKARPDVLKDVRSVMGEMFPKRLETFDAAIERVQRTPNHPLRRFCKG